MFVPLTNNETVGRLPDICVPKEGMHSSVPRNGGRPLHVNVGYVIFFSSRQGASWSLVCRRCDIWSTCRASTDNHDVEGFPMSIRLQTAARE